MTTPLAAAPLPDPLPVTPALGPIIGTAVLPGSKSITNRALALAALAHGTTTLTGALFADDTQRMMDCLRALGFNVAAHEISRTITVEGRGGHIPATKGDLFVGNSGTTARFITPLAALGCGIYTIDGVERMRARPIGDLVRALTQLGVSVDTLGDNGCPPLRIHATGLHGGACTVRSDTSSQFLSGLLLASPCADGAETRITLEGPVLSAPYITMTTAMVRAFGGVIHEDADGRAFSVPGRQAYTSPSPGVYAVEPDASAASYFWAAAALTDGRVRVNGLGPGALQGDMAFADVLEAMGCRVTRGAHFIEVVGAADLRGVTWDMNAISDTVMTLAAVAPFASSPTVIENVGHIRHKETDRLAAVAIELTRLGIRVEERADGMTIYPLRDGKVTAAVVQTYDDHRMAMAFALVGLRSSGVSIADPACVAKTFPDYFARLDALSGAKTSAS